MSWGLPFGIATQDISPGEYIRNTAMLEALNLRELPYGLPLQPNFRDSIVPHRLNEAGFTPGSQVRAADRGLSFMGYPREGSRGVGTRNVVAVVGVTSRTASFARVLADRCNPQSETYASVDGVVAVAHTEGSGRGQPNNLDLLLRTLAGFVVHPNVGAVLLVDQTGEPVDNGLLKRYLEAECHDFHSVPHAFLTVGSDFSAALGTGEGIVRQWLPAVNESTRQQASASCLRIALQCGGSDAFSGISGNPLVAWVARETIRNGGSATWLRPMN